MASMLSADTISEVLDEPIAIVGIGCRLPGESNTPSKLWENLLRDGKSAWSEIPKNRFNLDAWYHPDGNRPGSVNTRGGYFLSHDDSLRQFDPSFFGISPLEAASLDPQQRKLLEVVYESFENAGATLDELSGSKTSCFVGCFTNDMRRMTSRDLEYGEPYEMTGSDMTILSNRINYVFNLKGSSMTVDTACSSSLYALHLACQSLVSGDSEAAIVGGTNIINDIEQHIASIRLGVLSPTSTCHTFDERADGFGRGEGICAIYLKTLSAAVANNDPIRAVIRSTAVNTNGRSRGINHPSAEGQEACIRAAYTKANLNFADTGYFECHGTGTPVGDPIEVKAVANIFAPSRTPQNPLLLGSIKTNIGHTEGASGLASVIKAVLSIENGQIPATVGVENLNPQIDFKEGCLKVVRDTVPWPKRASKRVSINSFGYGGANAHCIVESPEIILGSRQLIHSESQGPDVGASLVQVVDDGNSCVEQTPKKYLFVFSAHDQSTLDRNIAALADVAESHHIASVAYTLAQKKTRHRHRSFATVTKESIRSQLLPGRIQHVPSKVSGKVVIAFVFTGQGAQWPGMGYGLIQQYQVAQAVVGHSSGEVAAAFSAGLLTISEAIAVAYFRGIAVTKYGKPGAMMAVGLGAEEMQVLMRNQPDVMIACQNSPQSVTLSGGAIAISQVHSILSQKGIFARILNTSQNAYHSHLVKDAGQYYESPFKSSLPTSPPTSACSDIPMYSCIKPKVLTNSNDVRIEYWRENLESPVNFTQALSSLLEAHPTVNCLIEIGMHSALSGPIKQIRSSLGIEPERLTYFPSIIRGEDSVENVLKLAGSLFSNGYPINTDAVNAEGGETGQFLPDLPNYQWNYEGDILWAENRLSRQLRFRKHPRHDILGSLQLGCSSFSPSWRNRLKLKDVPWISDHRIGSDVLFPAAGYSAMAIEAVTQFGETCGMEIGGYTFRHLSIRAPLIIAPDGEVETMFDLRNIHVSSSEIGQKMFEFSVTSVNAEDKWTEHAVGTVLIHELRTNRGVGNGDVKGTDWTENSGKSDEKWYTALAKIGLHYGPTFRPLGNIRTDAEPGTATALVNMKSTEGVMVHESRYIIHPTTLDACIQLAVIAACNGDVKGICKAYLPTKIDNLTIWQVPNSPPLPGHGVLLSHGTCRGMRSVRGASGLFTTEGRPLAQMSVSLLSLEGDFADQQIDRPREPFARLVWQPIIETKDKADSRTTPPKLGKLCLVYNKTLQPLAKEIETLARIQGIETQNIPLSAVDKHISKGQRVLMLAELEGPLLINMTEGCLNAVKTLFRLASSIVWVTRGGLLQGGHPEYSLISGMKRSIVKAQPSLQISSIDIDPDNADDSHSASFILQHESSFHNDDSRTLDDEFVISASTAYASRYILDDALNHDFARQSQPDPEICQIKENLELTFRQVGRVESFYFKEKPLAPSDLGADEVHLTPTVYGIGAQEAAILRGTQIATCFGNICVAIVEHTGPQTKKCEPGDRVVCFSPSNFDTSLTVRDVRCELLRPDEDAGHVVTSVLPYCTAVHILDDLARVAVGQTILIHDMPEAIAVAVIRYSSTRGFKVILTFESEEKKTLFEKGWPEDTTWESCVASLGLLADKVNTITGGHGVSLALTRPKGFDVSGVWQSLAKHGRLVYISQDSELPDLGLLDRSVFARGVSITSFDMNDMLETQPQELGKLVNRVLGLLRDGAVAAIKPSSTYDVSELPDAFSAVSQSTSTAGTILAYDRPSMVPINLPHKLVKLESKASYLLIGCLGGLGRSLVRWMISRGARNFVFLSRSGVDKPEAAEFVVELESRREVTVSVVRGDVGNRADVDRAIASAKTPIRGVMQLAMTLASDLFDDMSLESWHKVLDPKVKGTINLHEALLHEPLDFFVMTSSTLGTVGASTQSNYAAANAFLDSMARHRWSLGLEACSIALGMVVGVGHVESHPDIKGSFEQRGVYGIPEDDFIEMMEVACRPRGSVRALSDHDTLSVAHIVTGLEPGQLVSSSIQPAFLADPRFERIATAVAEMNQHPTSMISSALNTTTLLRNAAADGESAVHLAVRDLFLAHFSKLVMAKVERLTTSLDRPMSDFGMDSMIVAELRNWCWRELRADVPFMVLLEGGMQIGALVELIWEKMDHAIWKK
ncbi:ketoacyl-synt-domain-containing protein [Aureobasidium pullulans]|uniref:Ketoacyl-synt-domain-containing protein n=1 Tax=Aureobasidium pullulans TaxID=5580 RepID=A0AB74J795_AURPU|nr:ketoacyl-synt-domain-containing protein [Aureobasidium pullulans]